MASRGQLTPPNWDELTGGSGADKWQQDRLRKFAKIKAMAPAIAEMSDRLAEAGALFRCSREVLRKHPSAAEWYVALAGFSSKTLKSLQERAKTEFRLSVLPATFVEKMLARPDTASDADLAAFTAWINAELEEVVPEGLSEDRLAALHVAMIAGGRIIGQGQNEGGEVAVLMLKQALLEHFGPTADWRFVPEDGRPWRNMEDDVQVGLAAALWYHEPSDIKLDFRPGGNRPDVKATRENEEGNDEVVLVGEVKGRKDLSNTWESWMPQVAAHMDSWAGAFKGAYSGVFMTVFTEEMLTGRTPHSSEQRRGIKKLYEDGRLQYAINLTLLATEDEGTVTRFVELFRVVLRVPAENEP